VIGAWVNPNDGVDVRDVGPDRSGRNGPPVRVGERDGADRNHIDGAPALMNGCPLP